MQLKIQRSQRTGGVISSSVFFALDVRADYSRAEQDSISKYKLGKQIIYNSKAAQKHFDKAKDALDGSVTGGLKGIASGLMARLHLVVTIDSLGSGQHIECKDLAELIEAEDTIMDACKNVRGFLQVASTFDGRTILIDFDSGGEVTAHRSNGMPDLSRHAPPSLPAPQPTAPVLIEAHPIQPDSPPPAPVAPQPVAHSAPMRPVIADQPMRPSQMRQESSSESDFEPFWDRLDDEAKSKLLKGALAVLGAAILLYVLCHL
jgi:hypothetical protein